MCSPFYDQQSPMLVWPPIEDVPYAYDHTPLYEHELVVDPCLHSRPFGGPALMDQTTLTYPAAEDAPYASRYEPQFTANPGLQPRQFAAEPIMSDVQFPYNFPVPQPTELAPYTPPQFAQGTLSSQTSFEPPNPYYYGAINPLDSAPQPSYGNTLPHTSSFQPGLTYPMDFSSLEGACSEPWSVGPQETFHNDLSQPQFQPAYDAAASRLSPDSRYTDLFSTRSSSSVSASQSSSASRSASAIAKPKSKKRTTINKRAPIGKHAPAKRPNTKRLEARREKLRRELEVPWECLTSAEGRERGTYLRRNFTCQWGECKEVIVPQQISDADFAQYQSSVHAHIRDHAMATIPKTNNPASSTKNVSTSSKLSFLPKNENRKEGQGSLPEQPADQVRKRCQWRGCEKNHKWSGSRALERHIWTHVKSFQYYCVVCDNSKTRPCDRKGHKKANEQHMMEEEAANGAESAKLEWNTEEEFNSQDSWFSVDGEPHDDYSPTLDELSLFFWSAV